MQQRSTDLDLEARQIAELSSPDAIAGFLANLGYQTDARTVLTPEAVGLAGESANLLKGIELLSEDAEQFLRVVFAQPKSLTAKVRNDLVRVLGKSNVDHLLILASDFDTLEFVLLDKRKRESKGPVAVERIQLVPKVISVNRRNPTRLDLRILRRFTWSCRDGLEQFDKLRTVFDAAAYTGEYFQNRGLFADHYLRERLREDAAWKDNPSEMFGFVRDLLKRAAGSLHDPVRVSERPAHTGKDMLRTELFEPVFKALGFNPVVNRPSKSDQTQPDYLLKSSAGTVVSAAFVYPWDRWLDGPDLHDDDTPEENPGACVVTALDSLCSLSGRGAEGERNGANWIIVTNGRLWRLYGRQAHARSTNFYEVDLVEALTASGDTDPNEAFRFWWLFFRAAAFAPILPLSKGGPGGVAPTGAAQTSSELTCWLDAVLSGSRDFAKRLGDRLKDRIFVTIFPHLAQGFLEDRRQRLSSLPSPRGRGDGSEGPPSEEELSVIFEATLTLLYRLLFLLYAESRDLLPIRESPYFAASLKKIKNEVADKAGVAESDVPERLSKTYSAEETLLYDRLSRLFQAMDKGDPILNVPTYNGGLFNTSPHLSKGGAGGVASADADRRDQQIAAFLVDHKIPDRFLALAIDRLSRDQDERTLALVFIDYKSLEVRHLGSIYEGLLEFKLKVAEEDLTTQSDKKREKYIPLREAKASRSRKAPGIVVRKGDVYLSNDKAERKASGSYYTPDPIVEYIVANTVGPVLAEKLEALRPEFRKVRKTFDNELQKSQGFPSPEARSGRLDHRQWAGLQTYNHHRDLVERLFDLKAVDPAMGSGHFLVEVVDFVTDRLLSFLNQFPINPVTFALERTRASILDSLGEQGVTVEELKLTDINLLKRHVLKRCVYGVDLNPMAVELAKVSLWLDAFTLGAPLNFLDHHLRCGNSLVGASFEELAESLAPTVKSQGEKRHLKSLFRLDDEPLLRAIHHVLAVSRNADATAAEVTQSLKEYAQARDDLSGYRIVFDLLVAPYFGVERAADILLTGHDVKLGSRERFLASLESDTHRRMADEATALAYHPGWNFFHWELEFPEVFFGFADVHERRLLHRNEIVGGSAGFDAVIGNPPYVRMELIKPLKPFLKTHYECHTERADLFIYFYERAVQLLRTGGSAAFIAPSNWTKTNAGDSLRQFLKVHTAMTDYLDLSHASVFDDASTYPCVLVFRRSAPPPDHAVRSTACIRLDSQILQAAIRRDVIAVPQLELSKDGWHFEERKVTCLRDKMVAAGTPLVQLSGPPLYGIKTGLNQAFVVDRQTREALITRDKSSEELLKPFLEGKDVKPWRARGRDLWLIYTPHGVDIRKYAAVEQHLMPYREALEKRATTQKWYELQQPQERYSCEYLKPKIIYPRFVDRPVFALDQSNCFVNNAVSVIPTDDPVLLFFLMSPAAWFFLQSAGAPMANGYRQLHGHVVERVPIPRLSETARVQITRWVNLALDGGDLGNPPWGLLYESFGLNAQEVAIIEGVDQ